MIIKGSTLTAMKYYHQEITGRWLQTICNKVK